MLNTMEFLLSSARLAFNQRPGELGDRPLRTNPLMVPLRVFQHVYQFATGDTQTLTDELGNLEQ